MRHGGWAPQHEWASSPVKCDPVGSGRPATVLVVETEILVALMIEQTLADAGYRPLRSEDGWSGPNGVVDADTLAAAVLNLKVDGRLDGRDVIRRLRAARPSLPVVVVTGFPPGAPQADLRGLGGPTLRLPKPFDCLYLTAWLAVSLAPHRAPGPMQHAEPIRRSVERRAQGRAI